MSDEAAILAAIAANPTEDTPRLAYADWLDEHGDSAARVRAEFIRVQCELKRVEGLPSPDAHQYIDLYRRQDVILTDHRHDLLGPLGTELTYFGMVYDRGFVAELELTADGFLRHAAAIAALVPVPRVSVTDGAAHLWGLAHCEHAGLVAALSLRPPHRPYPDPHSFQDVCQALPEFNAWSRLVTLDLAGCGLFDLTEHDVARLADTRSFPVLTDLDLSRNQLTDDGVRVLVASALWPRLTRLILGGNPITEVAAGHIVAGAAASRLEYLNLRYTAIGPAGVPPLLRAYGGRVDVY